VARCRAVLFGATSTTAEAGSICAGMGSAFLRFLKRKLAVIKFDANEYSICPLTCTIASNDIARFIKPRSKY
jgi:hypothetical protein